MNLQWIFVYYYYQFIVDFFNIIWIFSTLSIFLFICYNYNGTDVTLHWTRMFMMINGMAQHLWCLNHNVSTIFLSILLFLLLLVMHLWQLLRLSCALLGFNKSPADGHWMRRWVSVVLVPCSLRAVTQLQQSHSTCRTRWKVKEKRKKKLKHQTQGPLTPESTSQDLARPVFLWERPIAWLKIEYNYISVPWLTGWA